MGKKSAPSQPPLFPGPHEGVQVNFCKQPNCPHFLRADFHAKRGPGRPPKSAHSQPPPLYIPIGDQSRVPYLECTSCHIQFPVKSNQGIHEELARLNSYFPEDGCPNTSCPNYKNRINVKEGPPHYTRHDRLKSGSQRYRCEKCNKVFTVSNPLARMRRQKHGHLNLEIFDLLFNKMPPRRICRHIKKPPFLVYDRIDFFYDRCRTFLADRERALRNGMRSKRLYISVDQQFILLNWPSKEIRKNIQLKAVAAADNNSMYVFGSFVNYDHDLNANKIEEHAKRIKDAVKPMPFRRYARLWLLADYDHEIAKDRKDPVDLDAIKSQSARIAASYDLTQKNEDIESTEYFTEGKQLPHRGMQIHNEYTLYGFFLYLKQLLPGAKKHRFYIDRDPGMRAACLAGFANEILARKCDAFYVSTTRKMTIEKKRASVREAYDKFNREARLHPDKTETEIKLTLLREKLLHPQPIGPYEDQWIEHPLPTLHEPEIRTAHLTNIGQYDEEKEIDHLAFLHNLGTLKGVNQYFMNVRRSISWLERPITSASNAGRKWHMHNPYSAALVVKLLLIYRTYYNFCRIGEDKKTPAERLGLAKGPVRIENILYGRRFRGYSFTSNAKDLADERYKKEKAERQRRRTTRLKKDRCRYYLRATNPDDVVYLAVNFDEHVPPVLSHDPVEKCPPF
jgi:transposase-like protein